MKRYLNLYGYLLSQQFKVLMEYRLSFWIGTVSTIIMQGAGVLAIWVVMGQIPELNGWKLDEILLIYGLLTLSISLPHMFADSLWVIGWAYVRSGDFDTLLVRPINPLFHLLANWFNHNGIGEFLVGLLLVVKAMASLGIPWTPLRVLYLVIAVVSGGGIILSLNLITATSAFWIVESVPVTKIVFSMHEFAKYPLSIYHRGIGFLLTWLVPYGFASFYPASYLLGREAGRLAWLGPLLAAGLLAFAYRFWQFGLRHYSSTGS